MTRYTLCWMGYGPTSGDLTVEVTVLQTKKAYGVPRALVTPVAGSGQRWVNLASLTPLEVPDHAA